RSTPATWSCGSSRSSTPSSPCSSSARSGSSRWTGGREGRPPLTTRRRSMRLARATLVMLSLASAATAEEAIFAPGGKLKVEAGKGAGGEGPAWHPTLGVLTSGAGHIWQLDPAGTSRIYRKDAGTNGLLFDRKGRLVACDSELRRVIRLGG